MVDGEPMITLDDALSGHYRAAYEAASIARNLMAAITWCMEQKGISEADLAGRMGVKPHRVARILSDPDGSRLTPTVLGAICAALDAHLEVKLVDPSS